jgi:hypothetical protein
MPAQSASVLAAPLLDHLLGDRHNPDGTSPMPRSASALLKIATPTQDAWASAYADGKDCKLMIDAQHTTWSAKKVREVSSCFRQPLLQGATHWQNQRLCISNVIEGQTRRLLLIIVPKYLWNTMFLAFHAAPSCGHMGRYKTLHRLRQSKEEKAPHLPISRKQHAKLSAQRSSATVAELMERRRKRNASAARK